MRGGLASLKVYALMHLAVLFGNVDLLAHRLGEQNVLAYVKCNARTVGAVNSVFNLDLPGIKAGKMSVTCLSFLESFAK